MDQFQSEQFQQPSEQQPVITAPLKHSGLGISSFIIAGSALLLIIISVISMIAVGASTLEGISTGEITEEEAIEVAPMLVIGGLIFMFSIFVAFIGGILGIVGLVQKNRKKLFAILGTVINWLLVLLIVFLMVIGIAMQA